MVFCSKRNSYYLIAILTTLTFNLLSSSNFAFAKHYNFSYGNKISILSDIETANNAKFNIFELANDHIHIMTYYWDKSDISFEFIESLRRAAKRGVSVRIVTNCHINLFRDIFSKTKRAISKPLKNGNDIDFLCFSPYNSQNVFTNNIHEKTIIVDGNLVIFGSRNFSKDSLEQRDLDFLLHGPVVNDFQDHFVSIYKFVQEKNSEKCITEYEKGDIKQQLFDFCINQNRRSDYFFDNNKYFPAIEPFQNGFKARLITNNIILKQYESGFKKQNRLDHFYENDDIVNTITSLDFKSIKFYSSQLLLTPYFNDFLLESLSRGKRVEIITNGLESSSYYSVAGYYLSHHIIQNLFLNNAEIYFWQKTKEKKYVHAKAMIIDDKKAYVGSHNFNITSSVAANELMLEVHSIEFAYNLTKYFEHDKTNHSLPADNSILMLENELIESSFRMKIFNFLKNKIIEFF